MTENNYPKLHNAMWPGLVGKGSPGAEPFIELDTMLDLTAKAEVGGVKFDGKNFRVGRKLDFDGKTEAFVNDAEANRHLTRVERAGFAVPEKV